jgi:hypothetical protein
VDDGFKSFYEVQIILRNVPIKSTRLYIVLIVSVKIRVLMAAWVGEVF